jgi:hypothetical protein
VTAPAAPRPGGVTRTRIIRADMVDLHGNPERDDTGRQITVRVRMIYSTRDPYAVRFTFYPAPDQSVDWVFARDLLHAGCVGPAGDGDARFTPCASDAYSVVLTMTSPTGAAACRFDIEDLAEFLTETYELVDDGEESALIDWDTALADLMGA